MFLKGQIKFKNLTFYLIKIIKFKIFKKYCNVKPKSVEQIYNLRKIVQKIVKENVKKN